MREEPILRSVNAWLMKWVENAALWLLVAVSALMPGSVQASSTRLSLVHVPDLLTAVSLERSKLFLDALGQYRRGAKADGRQRAGLLLGAQDALLEVRDAETEVMSQPEALDELLKLEVGLFNYEQLLGDRRISDAQLLKMIEFLQNSSESRLDSLKQRLGNVERQMDGLKQKLEAHKQQQISREEELRKIEGLLPKRHGFFTSTNPFLAYAPALRGGLGLGLALTLYVNVDDHVGGFVSLLGTRFFDFEVTGAPEDYDVSWNHVSAQLGVTYYLTPPSSFVSFRVGGGIGGFTSTLFLSQAGSPIGDSSESSIFNTKGVYLLLKTELGVAPPTVAWEPFAALGCMIHLGNSPYQGNFESTLGRVIGYLGLGLRYRTPSRPKEN